MNKFRKLIELAEALEQNSKQFTEKDAKAVKDILLPVLKNIADGIIEEGDKVVYSTFSGNGKSMTLRFEVDTSSKSAKQLVEKLKNYTVQNKSEWEKVKGKIENLGYNISANPFEFVSFIGDYGFISRVLIPFTVDCKNSNESEIGVQIVESLGSCRLASGGNWLTSFTDVKVLKSALEKLTSLNPPKLVDNDDCKSVILSLIKTKGLKDKVLQIIDRLTISTGGNIKQFQTKFIQEVNDLLEAK